MWQAQARGGHAVGWCKVRLAISELHEDGGELERKNVDYRVILNMDFKCEFRIWKR